ncbi:DUF1593 domain-containing protein [soil metagenome]
MPRRLFLSFALVALCVFTTRVSGQSIKPRMLVLTDISNEPDDEESLVRYLVYSNELDTEGLIATTSTWLKKVPREDLIRRDIAAYDQVRPNLARHAAGYPTAGSLLTGTKTGQPGYGMAFVGEGMSTAGSRHIIDVVDRKDARPVWVSVWGGANTLAQALFDVRASRAPKDVERFVAKMRVYTISDQDDAGPWLRREFPGLFYIVTPSSEDARDYPRATWTGISGDRLFKNGPRYRFDLVDNPWLITHVIENHGVLGALYPKLAYIMEGDTPSFLGHLAPGLGWAVSPSYGGWGGRYALLRPAGESRPIWTNDNDRTADAVDVDGRTEQSDQATVWRWREQFQNDFAARMNWSVSSSYAGANHNPVVVLNGDRTRKVLTLRARGGSSVMLTSRGSGDPDHNAVRRMWWIYPEAGTLHEAATLSASEGVSTVVRIPKVTSAGTIHVILEVEDDGEPHLVSYRRAVIEVAP